MFWSLFYMNHGKQKKNSLVEIFSKNARFNWSAEVFLIYVCVYIYRFKNYVPVLWWGWEDLFIRKVVILGGDCNT